MITTTRFRVAPGKMQDFENLIRTDVLPGFKKNGIALSINRRGLGTNGNDVTATSPVSKFADLDAGSAAMRALGQEGLTKVGAKLPGTAATLETVVRTRVADLSF